MDTFTIADRNAELQAEIDHNKKLQEWYSDISIGIFPDPEFREEVYLTELIPPTNVDYRVYTVPSTKCPKTFELGYLLIVIGVKVSK